MKSLLTVLVLFVCAASAYADRRVSLDQIPKPVTAAIEDYFPKSRLLTAKSETEKKKVTYEVIVQYKEILLEVEVSAEGKIIEVDTKG